MKLRIKVLMAVLAAAVGVVTWPVASGETEEVSQTQKLDELLRERQATLRQLVKVVTVEYRQGTSGFESVLRATDQLIDAELELAENAKGRIIILQRRVELMKSLFSMVEAKFKAGQVRQVQVLTAQAALLEAQIQLAREQSGEPTE